MLQEAADPSKVHSYSWYVIENINDPTRRIDHELPLEDVIHLYAPMTADLFEPGEYGDVDGDGVQLNGQELCCYADSIMAALVRERMPEEAERGIMHWYQDKGDL